MILAIFNLVLRIFAVVSGIDTIAHIIQGDTTNSAQETTKFLIQTNTFTTVNDLSDPTFGLAKLASNQALIMAAIAAARTDILTAIANLTNGTTPVVPSTPPPPPYVPPSSGSNASAVWNTSILDNTGSPISTLTAMQRLLVSTLNWQDFAPFQFRNQPFVFGEVEPAEDNFNLALFNRPPLLIQNLRTSDTVMSFFTREAPAFAWTQDTTHGGRVYANVAGEALTWVSNFYDNQLHGIAAGAVSSVNVPPVWPGLSNVILGGSLALSDGLTIPGPLDGVIIHVASVTYPVSFYPFGAVKSFVKIGGIIFVDDNGQAEMAQPLGLEQDVICPRTMVRADHAILRLKTGTTGTIQPWTHS